MASMSASEVESRILTSLNESGVISDSFEYALQLGIDHQVLVGVVKSLLVDRYHELVSFPFAHSLIHSFTHSPVHIITNPFIVCVDM